MQHDPSRECQLADMLTTPWAADKACFQGQKDNSSKKVELCTAVVLENVATPENKWLLSVRDCRPPGWRNWIRERG